MTEPKGPSCPGITTYNVMTIFSDFLRELHVPFTEDYADAQFRGMSFKSLFGFSRLLNSYNIPSEAVQIQDKSQLQELPTPFLAQTGTFFVKVTGFGTGKDGKPVVNLLHFGEKESWTIEQFDAQWSGIVLLALAGKQSAEPDYQKHHWHEMAMKSKSKLMLAAILFLGVFGFIYAGIGRNLSTILLTAVDIAGIIITWFLVLKTLKVKSASANKICGVLEEGGCDHVLEQKASTFFGLFSWSELGITYFSLSTLFLFLFPEDIKWLALINGCALPFTVWSIWYQKFRIKTWCTLCVTTQTLLWCQFFCYLFGGWWKDIFPLEIPLFLMGAAYLAVLLGVNAVMTFIKKRSGISAI